jgi:hypothetical protein
VLGFGSEGVVATETSEHVETEVAAIFVPLVVLLGEVGSDQPDQSGTIREDADHIGPAADFLIEAFLQDVAPNMFPDLLFGKYVERQQVRPPAPR